MKKLCGLFIIPFLFSCTGYYDYTIHECQDAKFVSDTYFVIHTRLEKGEYQSHYMYDDKIPESFKELTYHFSQGLTVPDSVNSNDSTGDTTQYFDGKKLLWKSTAHWYFRSYGPSFDSLYSSPSDTIIMQFIRLIPQEYKYAIFKSYSGEIIAHEVHLKLAHGYTEDAFIAGDTLNSLFSFTAQCESLFDVNNATEQSIEQTGNEYSHVRLHNYTTNTYDTLEIELTAMETELKD